MVYLSSLGNNGLTHLKRISFGDNVYKAKGEEKDPDAKLLVDEQKKHPIKTAVQIEGDKLVKAFSIYPEKGLSGSKNANFYEFLTMGTVPYLVGSGMMIGVFNYANKYFDTSSKASASKLGKKMALGVVFYGLAKSLSKSFIETPLNMKFGIDVNAPYRKKVSELPEKWRSEDLVPYEEIQTLEKQENSNNGESEALVSHEYHKAYESVEFPRWDLFYNDKAVGKERNSYYENIGKKMGFNDEELEYSDQKVKPYIKEKVIQTKLFSTLSSYLWAAVGVGLAVQKPFENMIFSPIQRIKDMKNGVKNDLFIVDFSKKLANSFKEFVGTDKTGPIDYIVNKYKHQTIDTINRPNKAQLAGRALFATALGTTLLGNFMTLKSVNKDKGNDSNASTSLIDESKEKVVC